jgi:hypothetical protein
MDNSRDAVIAYPTSEATPNDLSSTGIDYHGQDLYYTVLLFYKL